MKMVIAALMLIGSVAFATEAKKTTTTTTTTATAPAPADKKVMTAEEAGKYCTDTAHHAAATPAHAECVKAHTTPKKM